jgi:hypothetical protein
MKGLYEDSIRYYVRAVAMNPKADNAWQYLRISLRYASIVYFMQTFLQQEVLIFFANEEVLILIN